MQNYWNERNCLHNSHRVGLENQHGRRFIVLEHQYGRRDVMCKRSTFISTFILACENIRFSSLFAAWDVSLGRAKREMSPTAKNEEKTVVLAGYLHFCCFLLPHFLCRFTSGQLTDLLLRMSTSITPAVLLTWLSLSPLEP